MQLMSIYPTFLVLSKAPCSKYTSISRVSSMHSSESALCPFPVPFRLNGAQKIVLQKKILFVEKLKQRKTSSKD